MNAVLAEYVEKWRNSAVGWRIIAYGSSNTELCLHSQGAQNWVDHLMIALRTQVGRQVSVTNQGICGDTASGLLQRFDRDVEPFHPDCVIVTIGGNDAGHGVAVEDYLGQVDALCRMIRHIGAKPVLQSYYFLLYDQLSANHATLYPRYVEGLRYYAEANGIPLLDPYGPMEAYCRVDPAGYASLMLDGLHVNPLGNAVMGKLACEAFGLTMPELPAGTQRELDIHWSKLQAAQGAFPSEKKLE